MRIYDLIAKKRDGGTHSREELEAIVNGFVSGEVADYQMAAWMMAVYLRGMTDEETAELTDVMAHSGVMVDLSPIPGIKVDKHSTGGVGDKTTLVIAPIVAACGVKIAKMSGRGLGHTGGTIDKMESVPGTKTALSQEEFFAQVNKIGLSVIGQSEGIAWQIRRCTLSATSPRPSAASPSSRPASCPRSWPPARTLSCWTSLPAPVRS